jgi:tRNA(adenine34) deaminase
MEDETIMRLALEQAAEAARLGEVPVGAIVCRGDAIISMACKRRELDKNALAHAELLAIDAACKSLGGWRLHECDLFVTLEPCPMCTGAIINARIRRVVFGARDPKAGCFGSVADLTALPFNHRPEVLGGVLEQECGDVLREFFAELRKRK